MAKRNKRPPGNPNIAEAGKDTRFKKGHSKSKGKGRPKNIYNLLKEVVGEEEGIRLGKEDYKKLFQDMLNMSMNELKAIRNHEDMPSFVVYLASIIYKHVLSGKMDLIREIYDRFVERITPDVNNNINVNFQNLSLDDLRQLEIIANQAAIEPPSDTEGDS